MDGWKTSFLLGWPIFRCYVSFRECTPPSFFQFRPGLPVVFVPVPSARRVWPLRLLHWHVRGPTTSHLGVFFFQDARGGETLTEKGRTTTNTGGNGGGSCYGYSQNQIVGCLFLFSLFYYRSNRVFVSLF